MYFYVTNLQGDVIAIMNSSGTIVVEYTYDAWGYTRNTTGSFKDTLGKANALRYRGYVYDTETALYYLQSRYYNPGTGRFINADTLVSTGQGILGNNMFAYCLNNPIRYADISGSSCEERTAPEENDDEYRLMGAGVQLELSESVGSVSIGFGIEVIIYWDTPESQKSGRPIVAIYVYNEGNLTFDTKAMMEMAQEVADLLLNSIDLIRLDGVDAIKALMSGSKTLPKLSASISLSLVGVWGNNLFYGVDSYLEKFEYVSTTIGSIKGGYAWSDCCRAGTFGYNYTIGGSALCIALPTVSRGSSYYRLLWDNRAN